jgi:LmbE family N-acetylglucosaminyl deacetylase
MPTHLRALSTGDAFAAAAPAAARHPHHHQHPPRLLLVIAHPDDECLFFTPALLSVGSGNKASPFAALAAVDVLCLSNGACLREREWRSAVQAVRAILSLT